MSPNDVLMAVVVAILLISSVFIMYRALSLRKVLVDRPYRTRALWTTIGASSVILLLTAEFLDSVFGQVPTTITGVIVEAAIWGFVFLSLYGWIASNVDVAITADYFNRDVFLWRKGGKIIVTFALFLAYVLASLPSWWVPQFLRSNESNNLLFVVFVLVILYPALVIGVTYRRINDKRIKTYTLWVVLSIMSLLVLIPLPTWLLIFPSLSWIFCMYRSVDTLAIRTRNLTV